MTKLDDVPDDALEAELERRKKKANEPPRLISNPDFSDLIETVTSGLAEAIERKYEDEDFKHYVYEAAMESLYGKKFWEWRNKRGW